jgi:hypothetical protein
MRKTEESWGSYVMGGVDSGGVLGEGVEFGIWAGAALE